MPIKIITNEHKCEHLTRHIECMVGGNGTFECYNPGFHEQCGYKKQYQEIVKERERRAKELGLDNV